MNSNRGGKFISSRAPTITRADLAAAVYRRTGVSREEARKHVATLLAEIVEALSRGENIKLSAFGSFAVRAKRDRVGRNPKTGVETPIVARRVVVFKASRILVGQLNVRLPLEKRMTA